MNQNLLPAIVSFLFWIGAGSTCLAEPVHIRIRNEGNVPVYVSVAHEKGILRNVVITGWHEIPPSGWATPAFYTGIAYHDYRLAFAIKRKDGRFGTVNYAPTGVRGIERSEKGYPIPGEGKFKREVRFYGEEVPSGDASITFPIFIPGKQDYNESNDVTLVVKPDASDEVEEAWGSSTNKTTTSSSVWVELPRDDPSFPGLKVLETDVQLIARLGEWQSKVVIFRNSKYAQTQNPAMVKFTEQHEYGHFKLKHQREYPADFSAEQEREADLFATEYWHLQNPTVVEGMIDYLKSEINFEEEMWSDVDHINYRRMIVIRHQLFSLNISATGEKIRELKMKIEADDAAKLKAISDSLRKKYVGFAGMAEAASFGISTMCSRSSPSVNNSLPTEHFSQFIFSIAQQSTHTKIIELGGGVHVVRVTFPGSLLGMSNEWNGSHKAKPITFDALVLNAKQQLGTSWTAVDYRKELSRGEKVKYTSGIMGDWTAVDQREELSRGERVEFTGPLMVDPTRKNIRIVIEKTSSGKGGMTVEFRER